MIQQSSNLPMIELNQFDYDNINHDKKKRLTSDQLEALENSFQEEIKLDPDRKMKLAQELGCSPDKLRFGSKTDVPVGRLSSSSTSLRTILKEHGSMRQAPVTTTDMSGEETVESTPMAAAAAVDCNYMLNYDGATAMHSSYCNWTVLPSYP
ncbi:hypothetical protein E3N88_00350 [Mikania micrantha]|uniref:Homeobox-leucine zipper protein n=1 Tax=Mikania micrantha TaxID=192012 RepID=A0A5N6PXS7_9ASTR|nr:hypothetical protein E3N88_00350 [Mikania micrantha]